MLVLQLALQFMLGRHLFIYGIFNDSLSVNQDNIPLNEMTSEWWIGKDMEGIRHGLI
jgi:hypothetical protein